MLRKVLALLLAVLMAVGTPVSVLAQDANSADILLAEEADAVGAEQPAEEIETEEPPLQEAPDKEVEIPEDLPEENPVEPSEEPGEDSAQIEEEPEEELPDEEIAEEPLEEDDLELFSDVVASGNCGAQGDNVTWSLSEGGVLTISGKGAMADYPFSEEDWESVAPWSDFIDNITALELEEGITHIGEAAFYDCSALTGELDIPSTVTSIGSWAFSHTWLTGEIVLPKGMTTIESRIFYGSGDLTGTLVIPEGVTSIGDAAFGNTAISGKLVIPDKVTSIGEYAFGSTYITELVLGNNVKTIASRAFSCEELGGTLYIPKNVEYVAGNAFSMTKIENFVIDKDNENLCIENDILYNKDKTTILACSPSIKGTVTIPSSVKSIEEFAFSYCTGITGELIIPDSVVYIGADAFSDCSGITKVKFGRGITEINDSTFYYCNSLKSVDFGDSISVIGDYAFYNASISDTLVIPDSVTSIGEESFAHNNMTQVDLGSGIKVISNKAFYTCTNLEIVDIPDNITTIGDEAFSWCTSFYDLTIGEGVKTIGKEAFSSCDSLRWVHITDGVSSIGDKAFAWCDALSELTIGKGTVSIGKDAFLSCDKLYDVYFMGSAPMVYSATDYFSSFDPQVTLHYQSGESGWSNPSWYGYATKMEDNRCGTNLIWKITEDGTLVISGSGAMYDYGDYTQAYYEYDNCAPWYRYREEITALELEDGISHIGAYAFLFCKNIEGEIVIPSSVKTIGNNAFEMCGTNVTLVLSKGVTSIGKEAFYASGITGRLDIPDSVISIGDTAFMGCTGITGELAIPNSVTHIGEAAFQNCHNITGKLIIPDSVTSIEDLTFSGCERITQVNISENVTNIGDCAFSGTGIFGKVVIPDKVISIGESAFSDCENIYVVVIGESVNHIGNHAFYSIFSNIEKVFFRGDAPEELGYDVWFLYGFNDNVTINYLSDKSGWTTPTWNGYVTETYTEELDYDTSGYCGGEGDGTNLTWELSVDGTLTISGEGKMAHYSTTSGSSSWEFITTAPWGIYKNNIKKLVLEEGITLIGMDAFLGCSEITGELVLPTTLERIYNSAFQWCEKLSGDLILPENLGFLAQSAFAGCGFDGTLYIPPNLTYIGTKVFTYSEFGFNEIIVDEDSRFYYTDSLILYDKEKTRVVYCSPVKTGKLVLPDTLTAIEESVFEGCENLTGELIIPDSVVAIEDNAFYNCSGFTGLTIGSGVESIGRDAFYGWDIDEIYFKGNAPEVFAVDSHWPSFDKYVTLYYMKDKTGWTTPTWNGFNAMPGANTPGVIASGECGGQGDGSNLQWELSKDGVLTVSGRGAMGNYNYSSVPWKDYRSEIKKVIIEDGVTTIGEYAFLYCTKLQEISLGNSVTTIKVGAFLGCGLKGMTLFIPKSVASIEGLAFSNTSPADFVVEEGNKYFCSESQILYNKDKTTIIFCSPHKEGELIISETVTKIAAGAFSYCNKLTGDLRIPDNVTYIGYEAFVGCSGFTSVTIGKNVNTIGSFAFVDLGVDEVYFEGDAPEKITPIGKESSFDWDTTLRYTCAADGWTSPEWNGFKTVQDNHSEETLEKVAPTCTQSGLTEGKYCLVCEEVLVKQEKVPAVGHTDSNFDLVCDECFVNILPTVSVSQDYMMLTKLSSAVVPTVQVEPAEYTEFVELRLESAEEDVDPYTIAELSNDGAEIIGVDVGTVYLVAEMNLGEKIYSARCRVDVTDEDMSELTLHAGTTAVTGSIYSTNYPEIEVIFDLAQNMELMSEDIEELSADVSTAIEEAYFVDAAAADMFMLHVLDDRTLLLVPTVDVTDAAAVKAVKSSYKSAIAVVVDGVELITPEVVSIKVDKKLPTVKAGAVKLNSFYSGQTQPLVFDCKNGEVVAVELDEDNPKAKGVPCPEWLILDEDNMTVSLVGDVAKASGKLYLDVYVEGYSAPVSVVVSVSAAVTAPKVKLSASKLTFNATRHNASANQVSVISGDKKVAFEALGIVDVIMPAYEGMTAKDQKTYAAQQSYEVVGYNAETGVITINSAAPVKGKILLTCEVEGSDTLINLPISVDVYTKAPTVKLSASSVTLNPNILEAQGAQAALDLLSDDIPVSLYEGPDNITELSAYIDSNGCSIKYQRVDNTQIYYSLISNFGKDTPFTSAEITDAKNYYPPIWKDQIPSAQDPETLIRNAFPCDDLGGTIYVLFLHMDQNFKVLGHSQFVVTLPDLPEPPPVNKLSDWAAVDMVVTPADLKVSQEDVSWEIVDGKKNDCEGHLDVGYANGKILVATNGNTQPGMTYKVNIMLEGMAKPAVLSVKTVAANKSDVKLAVSAKGKLVTTDPDAEVIITPKWTNFGGNKDLSENFKVYGTLKNEFTNVDFTECFDITKKADGTYSLTVKDLEAMANLHPKATYNLAVEDVVIGGSAVAAPKPVKLSLTLTKAKVEQSTKTVNLYPNDRFSTAVVELNLKDNSLPAIAVVEPVVDAKKPSAYDAKYLGNGKVEISFINNELSKKDGSVKLNVYLEGNDPDNAQPNATVTVSVKLAKFKTK